MHRNLHPPYLPAALRVLRRGAQRNPRRVLQSINLDGFS
jgi:hypothetical protein